jgi:hypothetical protein
MLLRLVDTSFASFSPAVGVPAGNIFSQTALNTGVNGPLVPTIEPMDRTVNDVTPTTPAAVGQLLTLQFVAPNLGGANWVKPTTAALVVPDFGVGVVYSAATAVGNEATIRMRGVVLALVTTGASPVAAVGSILQTTTAGTLTPFSATPATPGALGTNIAWALQAVAASQTNVLTLVYVGGTNG